MSVLYIKQIQTIQFRVNNNIMYGSRRSQIHVLFDSPSSLKAWKNL